MYRNRAEQTGSNVAPLGNARRWGSGGGDSAPSDDRGGGGYDRRDDRGGGYGGGRDDRGGYGDRSGGYGGGRDDRGGGGYGGGRDDHGRSGYGGGGDDRGRSSGWDNPPPPPPPQELPGGERKRKSRWGNEKADTGMVTAITGGVEGKDLESYAVQLRLDEIARALRTGLVVPPDGSRSPSPPPTYDSHGRRTNTREVRYRRRLEDERNRLVDRQMKLDPTFKPPADYLMAKKSSGRPQDKVYIPVKEFPEINFFGLLVGPRGNSLKKMERESGAKISIRGKGSVKEGKGRPGGGFDDDENDELHCLVMADTEEKVQKCVKLINSVIEIAASVPEGQNDHKRNQLRELAQLNGTLRDDENQICQNCGGIGHRKYDCPEQKNWTAGIICRVCGGAGHMARDCTQRRPGGFPGAPGFGGPPGGPGGPNMGVDPARAQQFDSEYASLMAELGETSSAGPVAGGSGTPGQDGQNAGPQAGGGQWANQHQHPLDDMGNKIPPWRIPSNWNPPGGGGQHFNRGPPPQQPQHAAYQGTHAGYSSFPQANYAAQQYGGGYQQQQQQGYGGYQQYPQA